MSSPLPGFLVVNISDKLKWESLNEFDPEHLCAKHESFGDLLWVNISKIMFVFTVDRTPIGFSESKRN